MNALLVCAALFLAPESSEPVGLRDPSVADAEYVEFGKKFPYVVKVSCGMRGGSGTAISDHVVVTAAHVVSGASRCSIRVGERRIDGKVAVHPGYRNRPHVDLAVIHTDEPIGLPWYPGLYKKDDETGKVCTIAGYGKHGTFLGSSGSDGKLRAGSNVIDAVDGPWLLCSPLPEARTELEILIASGDSGGGLFVGDELAGVNAEIWHRSGGNRSAHTRISPNAEWIEQTGGRLLPGRDKPDGKVPAPRAPGESLKDAARGALGAFTAAMYWKAIERLVLFVLAGLAVVFAFREFYKGGLPWKSKPKAKPSKDEDEDEDDEEEDEEEEAPKPKPRRRPAKRRPSK